MSGTATQGADYTLSGPSQVTIQVGQSFATVTLHALTDHVTEGNETATMTLNPGAGYTVSSSNSATVLITDSP
jgi:hypothetical protein